jgi:hypothetical protein
MGLPGPVTGFPLLFTFTLMVRAVY